MKIGVKKGDIFDIAKSLMLAILINLALIVIFAVVVKFTDIPDECIMPINIIIKCVSIVAGVMFSIKNAERGALKGAIVGILFELATYLMFGIINSDFSLNLTILIDTLVLFVIGTITGIITVNIKGRNKE